MYVCMGSVLALFLCVLVESLNDHISVACMYVCVHVYVCMYMRGFSARALSLRACTRPQ